AVRSHASWLNGPCGGIKDYRADTERARTNVSLWLRFSPGVILSSNFTIRGFRFASFWTFGAFGLDCADAIVSLWLVASFGAIRSSNFTIRSPSFGASLTRVALGLDRIGSRTSVSL